MTINKNNLTGKKYNYLTFLYKDPNHNKKWICQCDCGNKTSVYPDNVKSGKTKSCGCLHSKISYKDDIKLSLLNILSNLNIYYMPIPCQAS